MTFNLLPWKLHVQNFTGFQLFLADLFFEVTITDHWQIQTGGSEQIDFV